MRLTKSNNCFISISWTKAEIVFRAAPTGIDHRAPKSAGRRTGAASMPISTMPAATLPKSDILEECPSQMNVRGRIACDGGARYTRARRETRIAANVTRERTLEQRLYSFSRKPSVAGSNRADGTLLAESSVKNNKEMVS